MLSTNLVFSTNALLNYIFIYGVGVGVFRRSAGLGTFGVCWFLCVFWYGTFYFKVMVRHVVHLVKRVRYTWRSARDIARMSFTIGLNQILEVGFSTVIVAMLGGCL